MDDRWSFVGVENSDFDQVSGSIRTKKQRHVVVLVVDGHPVAQGMPNGAFIDVVPMGRSPDRRIGASANSTCQGYLDGSGCQENLDTQIPLPATIRARGENRWQITVEFGASTISRYHDVMAKQTTVRLPDELADEAEVVARVKGTSVNSLIIESLTAEIERVRADKDFTSRACELLKRDKELLDRLGQ